MIYDVTVIGGGSAGAATALSLASRGAKVTLIERRPQVAWKIGETLAPSAHRFLAELGLIDGFLKDGHLPSPGNCSIWGSSKPIENDFIFNPYGSGWQLDRVRFECSLIEAAAMAGAEVRRGLRVESVYRGAADTWDINTSSGLVRSRWAVDASGRGNSVMHTVAGPRESLDRLVSIYAVVSAIGNPDQRTWIESVADGWWYTAQMPGQRRTIAFQTDAALLRKQVWRHAEWFQSKLAETVFIAGVVGTSPPAFVMLPRLTSAVSARRRFCCGPGWVAVGDAALSYDPLSGAGLSKALESASRASALVTNPSAAAFRAYSSWVEDSWRRFTRDRRVYYRQETRWIHQPFWRQFSRIADH
jgi:flavin-dependent dehydrogenase